MQKSNQKGVMLTILSSLIAAFFLVSAEVGFQSFVLVGGSPPLNSEASV